MEQEEELKKKIQREIAEHNLRYKRERSNSQRRTVTDNSSYSTDPREKLNSSENQGHLSYKDLEVPFSPNYYTKVPIQIHSIQNFSRTL